MKCHYCKESIGRRVKQCPHCGKVNPTVNTQEIILWTIGMSLLLYLLGWVSGG